MAQLSLYIDRKTLEKIEIAAKLEHLSISKYVVRKLNDLGLKTTQIYLAQSLMILLRSRA
jgi:hypothetical protein